MVKKKMPTKVSRSKKTTPKKSTATNKKAQKESTVPKILHPAILKAIAAHANGSGIPLTVETIAHIVGGKASCICEAVAGSPGNCRQFWLDPDGQQYGTPPGGIPMTCAACKSQCRS